MCLNWVSMLHFILLKFIFELCTYCHKGKLKLVRITSWITIFFIPIIPYKQKHYLSCDNCEMGYEIGEEMVEKLKDSEDK